MKELIIKCGNEERKEKGGGIVKRKAISKVGEWKALLGKFGRIFS